MANTVLFVFSDVYELVLWSSEDVRALEMFFFKQEESSSAGQLRNVLQIYKLIC